VKSETKEEKQLRVLLERESLNSMEFGVFCLGLYEGGLTHDEAVLEAVSARKNCDCGGQHIVRPIGKKGEAPR
jgi:hypothetical protein